MLKLSRFFRLSTLMLTLLCSVVLFSCGDDDAPVIELSITSFTPTAGVIGSEVVITGTGFSTTLAENSVRFGVTEANVTAATATRITATVPAGVTTSLITVAVTRGGQTRTTTALSPFNVTAKPVIEVTGELTGTVNWTKGNIYLLKGFVRVGKDGSPGTAPTSDNAERTATLNIEAGTLILGDRTSKGTLIVQRGSTINAVGTAQEPIVFTSARPIGLREPGDWGGVVVCGYADNNQPSKIFELEGNYGAWSGGRGNIRNTDNSGTMQYVRIEYAGVAINPNQEVNSLTMGAVGSGTTFDYIQCSFGLDDAFEWFGGTNSSKYLIAYRGLDDDFDVDFGWSGNVQFGIGIRGATLADQSGSNGFEVDNNGGGTPIAPYTSGTFSNITIIGPKADREEAISLQFQNCAHLRRSNQIKIHNSFFTAYPNGILIDGPTTVDHAEAGTLVLKNNILAGVDNWGGNGFGSAGTIFTTAPANGNNHPNAPRGFRVSATRTALGSNNFSNGVWTFEAANINTETPEAWFTNATNNNQIISGWNVSGNNLNLSPSIFELGTPTLLPGTGSILLTGASFTGLPAFFTTVTHRGAFGATDWTAGWAEWNPSLVNYGF